MRIIVKNKDTLLYDEFKFKCSIGKFGVTSFKREGDKKTPKGVFSLGSVYFRKDRVSKFYTKLKKKTPHGRHTHILLLLIQVNRNN